MYDIFLSPSLSLHALPLSLASTTFPAASPRCWYITVTTRRYRTTGTPPPYLPQPPAPMGVAGIRPK